MSNQDFQERNIFELQEKLKKSQWVHLIMLLLGLFLGGGLMMIYFMYIPTPPLKAECELNPTERGLPH
jgi:hypothetical protein